MRTSSAEVNRVCTCCLVRQRVFVNAVHACSFNYKSDHVARYNDYTNTGGDK